MPNVKLAQVDFVAIVSFGGSLKSATSGSVIGDRPGQTPVDIELTEDMCFVKLTKKLNGKMKTKYVPMTNISSLEYPEKPAEKTEKTEPKK